MIGLRKYFNSFFSNTYSRIENSYNIFLFELINNSILVHNEVNNIKVIPDLWPEFVLRCFQLKQSYALSEFDWLSLVLKTYFDTHLAYFKYSFKRLIRGDIIREFWTPMVNYWIINIATTYNAIFGDVKYVLIISIRYTRETFIFYHRNLDLNRHDIKIVYLSKLILNQVLVYYNAIKTLVLPILAAGLMCLILISFSTTNLIRQVAAWLVVGLIFFWLISGFNFFLKRYRFGKFTSAIQRFWKRANTYFWLVEGFLFSLFFYYYLNSSQEPLYMYDESNLNQVHLFSLINAYLSYILLVFIIFYSFYLILNINNFNSRQQIAHLTLITLFLIYIYLIESYQFYYVLTSFIESFWIFDAQANVWTLEFEVPRLRAKHQYLLLALVAKYWHFLFIFLSWLFFAVKSFEQKRIFYALFGANIQNLIILFGLNILFYVQWLKWMFKRFYDAVYYWFFVDPNSWTIYTIFNAVYDFLLSIKRCVQRIKKVYSLIKK